MESEEDGSFGSDVDTSYEETLFEYVYKSSLEAIFSSQTARISPLKSDSDGYKTPTSAPPRLNGGYKKTLFVTSTNPTRL